MLVHKYIQITTDVLWLFNVINVSFILFWSWYLVISLAFEIQCLSNIHKKTSTATPFSESVLDWKSVFIEGIHFDS
jgi:hypothetical protein